MQFEYTLGGCYPPERLQLIPPKAEGDFYRLRTAQNDTGWVWKRPTLVAKDDDSRRIEWLARIRFVCEQGGAGEALLFVDELDISLWPKVGAA